MGIEREGGGERENGPLEKKGLGKSRACSIEGAVQGPSSEGVLSGVPRGGS